ncbi:MAG TPA: VCBS repeat-containing protein [Rudaea sp.]
MVQSLWKNGALPFLALCILLAGCQPGAVRAPGSDSKVFTSAEGRAYRVERIEKKPGGYEKVSGHQVRIYSGGFYDIEREDDRYFYVRQYVPVPVAPIEGSRAPAPIAVVPPSSETFSWQPFDEGLPRTGQWRDNFAVADMNGDGWPDLIFAPARKAFGPPTVFLSNGKGHWTRWKASFPTLAYDYGGAAVGDFNGDRKPDIVLGMHLLGIEVVTGDGKGKFADHSGTLPRRQGAAPPRLSSRNVLAFDWNGDGKAALVALNEHIGLDPVSGIRDGAVVFVSDPHGSWSAVPSEPALRNAALIATDRSGKQLALLEKPSASGELRVHVRHGGTWSVHEIGGFPADVLLGGFAFEGADDEAVFAVSYFTHVDAVWWRHIDLIRRNNATWERVPLLVQDQRPAIRSLAFGKFRAGKFADLVYLDEGGEAGLLRQDGDGRYTLDRALPAPSWRAGCEGYGLRTADLDRDGIDEVVLSFAGEPSALTGMACRAGGAVEAFKISSK